MDGSPGFGSTTYYNRAIHTRFRYAFTLKEFKLQYAITRWLILQ